MITPRQRQLRRKSMGGSDAAAICGVSPWSNAADVYWSKVGESAEQDGSEAMQAGNLLEGAVLDWFRQETGKSLIANQRRIEATGKPMHANLDAIVRRGSTADDVEIVQAKTTGITGPGNPDEWGDGDEDVPVGVYAQTQHEMLVARAVICWVPVLIGRVGFRLYRVERNNDHIKDIVETEMAFWENHVVPKVPPPDVTPSIEVLKRIRRVPEKVVDFDPVGQLVVDGWRSRQTDRIVREMDETSFKNQTIALLGDAEAANLPDGRMLTYFQYDRNGFDLAQFKQDHPDLAAKYAKRSTYRKLLIRGAANAAYVPQLKGKPNEIERPESMGNGTVEEQ